MKINIYVSGNLVTRGSVVGTLTRPRAGRSGFRIPVGTLRFLSCSKLRARLLGRHPRIFSGYRVPFPAVERLVCESDHPPPSNVKVKNERICTSIPTVYPHDAVQQNIKRIVQIWF
jgi:hypothetical protein